MAYPPPNIPDGTVLEYFPNHPINALCVDSYNYASSWMCYIQGSLPLERGAKVTVYKKKGLFGGSKFTLKYPGGTADLPLLEHTPGSPKRKL